MGTSAERVAVHTLHQHDAPGSDFATERLLAEHGLGGLYSNAQFDRAVMQRLAAAAKESLAKAQPVTHVGLGTGNALSINAFTRQGVIGSFSDVSLTNVGDQIQLRFDVQLTGVVPNSTSGFRFGLYNDNGPALSSGYRAFVGTGTSSPRTSKPASNC